MRAKSVNFERGKDPMDSMDIGMVERRMMDGFFEEMIEKHGGEKSIVVKKIELFHYIEGYWTSPEDWSFCLMYDITAPEGDFQWFVGYGKKEPNIHGKDTFEEATEWIRLQYKSKIQTRDFENWARGTTG